MILCPIFVVALATAIGTVPVGDPLTEQLQPTLHAPTKIQRLSAGSSTPVGGEGVGWGVGDGPAGEEFEGVVVG
ncbi:hypothetical protein GCM10023195_05820 [Actinoallomurus liliacearum]|uniref:Secreted protein n=1 Tax=Actinoallomurus liliacearum TaxID=1080073 RepID=A0ABP8TDJ0_9ACTN